MAQDRHAHLKEKIARALAEPEKSRALFTAVKRGRDKRAEAVAAYPGGEDFREEARAIKTRCSPKMEELAQRFASRARERGSKVSFAKDGEEAIRYVLDLARERNAATITKAKSLTTEEISLNHPLIENGVRVTETDLGELIIQLAGEKPFHLVFPAVHKTAEEVAELFRKEIGQEIAADAPSIMQAVRPYLRPIFLDAGIGLTGANVGVAQTGAIVIETNEGNARLVTSIPDTHVCVIGMEKIVETTADALKLALAHPISAAGQILTTYATFMAGRAPLGATGRQRETHIIILDNGRAKANADPELRDALHCIRCGACMNICPTYGVVGGHVFGHIYPGPIGIPWTAIAHGLDKAAEFAPLCISCGLCKRICPVDIDIPMMIATVKDRDNARRGIPLGEKFLMEAGALSNLGCATAPLSNLSLKIPFVRRAMEFFLGLDKRRILPAFRRDTFRKWFRRRKPPVFASNPKRRVVLFLDIFADCNMPELAIEATRRLEALGCEVSVPKQKWSGFPHIGYGDLARARRIAEYNLRHLAPYAEQGFDIVSIEPTATGCLRHDYGKLLPGDKDAEAVSQRTYEIFEYLTMLESESAEPLEEVRRQPLSGRRFGFHVSCHQRLLGAGTHAMEWLRKRGAQIDWIETGTCCGMGGTFGMKSGVLGYELAQAVGQPLFQAFKESGVEAIVTESSVCRMHLGEGTGMNVIHPLELCIS